MLKALLISRLLSRLVTFATFQFDDTRTQKTRPKNKKEEITITRQKLTNKITS
jgi:hypothetical protein